MTFFSWLKKQKEKKNYSPGARTLSPKEINKKFKKNKLDLPLGSVQIPVSLEKRHTIIIGKPGVGMTQALRYGK